jgi:hypothetical protein
LGAGFPAVSLLALLAPPQPAIDGQPFGLGRGGGGVEVLRCRGKKRRGRRGRSGGNRWV